MASSYDPGLMARNGSSAAARWISGLGAFLLVAAAGTFVAVRWDDIPDEAKFGALVALTVACLAADTRLRGRLPITASAVFHLGVLLVPIDIASVGLWLGWGWPTMLLVQGVAVTVACGLAGLRRGSVVLVATAALGVVLLVSGIGAVFDAPAGLLLAAVALAAAVTSPKLAGGLRAMAEQASTAWATLAGLATPLAAAEHLGWPAAGVLSDLGIAGDAPHPLAAVTGAVSGVGLALVATRRRSTPVALLGLASLVTGGGTTWGGSSPSAPTSLVALAAVLLLVEVTAWLLRRDSFWARPTDLAARLGELVAGIMTIGFAGVLLSAPFPTSAHPTAALAAALVALVWAASIGRVVHPDPRQFWPWTTVSAGSRSLAPCAAALAAASTGVLATEARPVRALTILVLGGLVVALPSTALPGATVNRVLAVGLLAWAPVAVSVQPELAGPMALAGAFVAAVAAVDTARFSGPPGFNRTVYTLATLSLAPLAVGGIVVSAHGEPALAVGGAIVAGWLLAALLDRATLVPASPPSPPSPTWAHGAYRLPRPHTLPVGMVPRLAALVPLAAIPVAGHAFTPGEALAIAGLFAVLAVVDAVRLDEPLLVVGAGCAVPIALASAVFMADGTLAQTSIALTLSGPIWLGLGALLPARWAPSAVLSAGVAAAAGLLMSTEESWAFSINLVVIGLALLLVGLAVDSLGLMATGGVAATMGLWVQLDQHAVEASEAYLAPIASMLLLGGLCARRTSSRPTSSWLAYAPAVALLGGAGLVERLGDGAGWHAVLAGVVGLVAVAGGGLRRLSGPLFTGTAVVVAVTVHETLGATAHVPTWAWLAAGGATLLAIGLYMERQGTGPLETGRRLVDLVDERFT